MNRYVAEFAGRPNRREGPWRANNSGTGTDAHPSTSCQRAAQKTGDPLYGVRGRPAVFPLHATAKSPLVARRKAESTLLAPSSCLAASGTASKGIATGRHEPLAARG